VTYESILFASGSWEMELTEGSVLNTCLGIIGSDTGVVPEFHFWSVSV